jgi:hypothetical protein
MRRPQHSMSRPHDCDKSHAEFALSMMEAAAFLNRRDDAAVAISGKWLSVFVRDGSLMYDWQGGYPTSAITREAAISVLTHC